MPWHGWGSAAQWGRRTTVDNDDVHNNISKRRHNSVVVVVVDGCGRGVSQHFPVDGQSLFDTKRCTLNASNMNTNIYTHTRRITTDITRTESIIICSSYLWYDYRGNTFISQGYQSSCAHHYTIFDSGVAWICGWVCGLWVAVSAARTDLLIARNGFPIKRACAHLSSAIKIWHKCRVWRHMYRNIDRIPDEIDEHFD